MLFPLGLRGKAISILAATIFTAAASAVLATLYFYGRSIDRHESEEAREAIIRAWALVEDDMDQLEVLANDWATWDDTWNFMKTRDRRFIESNLAYDSILGDLRISAMFMLDGEGETAYEVARDESWLPGLEASYRKARPTSSAGWARIVRAGTSLQLAAGKPIQRSDGSGERRGTLVMTRRIDETLLARYSWLSGVSVGIRALPGDQAGDGPPVPAEGDPEKAIRLAKGNGAILASMPIPAMIGGTAVDFSISMRGGIGAYGGLPVSLFVGAIVLIVVLVGTLAIALFDAALLGRMRTMAAELALMPGDAGKRARLTESGDDELAALARSMNVTLDALYSVIGERDAAIREIHHRVKNNLQVISSLVSLQAGKAGAADATAFSDIRRRVLAISYVHEELYLDREIERVDAERLFSKLASMIADTYDVGTRVRVDVECGRFSISLEEAVPIGLVACEIISNSFCHAFPEGRAGSIRVSARAESGGKLRLEIADDGVGIADDPRKGLGLSLVETLARQSVAEYTIAARPEGGTAFVMIVPDAATA
jgi:two-component sensor histidine kinase